MALFPLIAISASLVQILIKLMVAFYAVKFFCDAKRNGALELLLSTPLTEQEFARGQFLSLARIFAWPVIVGSTLGIATALTRLPFQPQPFAARPYFFAMTVLVIGDLIALAWVGMWMGFRSNGTMAAATRTIVIVLIAPWFLITAATPMLVMSPVIMAAFGTKFLLFQPFFLLLKDLLLIAWARGNLFQKLRDRPAPPPFDNPPPQIPLAPPAAVPPVINSR